MDLKIGSWNIRGLSTSNKQTEIRNFIEDESLNFCAVLETHIKQKKLYKIGNDIFGNWEWVTNMQYCDKGCRIMVGGIVGILERIWFMVQNSLYFAI